MLSLCVFVSLNFKSLLLYIYERCAFKQMRDLRLKNPRKVIMGHLNINSIPNKFEGGIMDLP